MKLKFLIFIFYNIVSQAGSEKNQKSDSNKLRFNKNNYIQATIHCEICFCDDNNVYGLNIYVPYNAIIHMQTRGICFMYPQDETMNPTPFPVHLSNFQIYIPENYPVNSDEIFVSYPDFYFSLNSAHLEQSFNHTGSYLCNIGRQSVNFPIQAPNPQREFLHQPTSHQEPEDKKKMDFGDAFNIYYPNPHIFFDPRFFSVQNHKHNPPKLIINRTNVLHEDILRYIWKIFIIKIIDYLEPTLLKCLDDCRNNDKMWNVFEDKNGLFQREEDSEIFYHKPEKLEDFCFYKKKYLGNQKTKKNKYLVLKGEIGPNFKNMRWYGNNVFIWDCRNIEEDVSLYQNVFIGPGCIIRSNSFIFNSNILKENVQTGPNTHIGFYNYLGDGCRIGVDIKDIDIQTEENVVPLTNDRIISIKTKISDFKTIIKGYNYIGDNVIFRKNYVYLGYSIYNYIHQKPK